MGYSVPRVSFGIIVLNGEPFLRYNLASLYRYAHQIIVVEGACIAAASLATPDGHSKDGTLEMLKRFKETSDPEDKLLIITGEDEGKPNGFWSEKDEMSQAYANRVTGDWLWQVDADEFYLDNDINTILSRLKSDPDISGISFPYLQFWGGFEYLEDGQWFRYNFPSVDRIFRWGTGYSYVSHRPPTVIDDQGRNLRKLRWISYRQMKRAGIFLYHYSCVLPEQARQKAGYYKNVTWTDCFRDDERWLKERFFLLKRPYHIDEMLEYLSWLVRYNGPHPSGIIQLREDIANNRLKLEVRPTDDIERLLETRSYQLGKRALNIYITVKGNMLIKPLLPIYPFVKQLFRRVGIFK